MVNADKASITALYRILRYLVLLASEHELRGDYVDYTQ